MTCNLDAFPSNVSFRWRFNNSGEMVDISPDHIKTKELQSSLSYVARTDLDYGTLLCWGSNSLGTQKDPCLYRVIPAELPKPPVNCSVLNGDELSISDYRESDEAMQRDSAASDSVAGSAASDSVSGSAASESKDPLTNDMLDVKCESVNNLDLPIYFNAIAYNANTNRVIQSITNRTIPEYQLRVGKHAADIEIAIFSVNKRGTSEKIILRTRASVDIAEKRTAQVRHNPSQAPVMETHGNDKSSADDESDVAADKLLVPLLAVVLGVLGSVGLIAVVAVLLLVIRRTTRGTQVMTVPCSLAESPDSNPDVIPSLGE